jgi:hypothetical protein
VVRRKGKRSSWFFGPGATTQPVVRDLMAAERPDFIVHTAAQPSHDKAAPVPYVPPAPGPRAKISSRKNNSRDFDGSDL